MPDVDENRRQWTDDYDWSERGEEWSERWGSSAMQWYGTVLPRLHAYVPTGTILEIAPGFGRWSRFLKDLCRTLYLVDLSETCIEGCRQRFAGEGHLEMFVNDGRSLDMIPDASLDLAFSFDSLVHVEEDVISAYLGELARKLKPSGVGFLHHSNLGEYAAHFRLLKRIKVGRGTLRRLGLVDSDDQWRAYSMTAEKFRRLANEHGLVCLSQELVNWKTKRLIDCISIFARRDGPRRGEGVVLRNPRFMDEADRLARLAALYSRH